MKEVLMEQADELGSSGLGLLLKELRASRRLTQTRAAEAAGLSRHTLLRWEQGSHQPRLPELTALLDALQASREQRARALALIRAPRAIQTLRAEQPLQNTDNSENAWVFTPETGDLLRTMRLRRGMTQEDVAEQMGVRRISVTHWEKAERLPSDAHLEELLDLMGARPEERQAMTNGLLLPTGLTAENERSFDALIEYYNRVHWGPEDKSGEAKELEYLRLERALADLVPYHPEARQYLVYTYSFHSQWLINNHRYKEAERYADRVLEASYEHTFPSSEWKRSILTMATCAVHGGNAQLRPERGIEMLQGWLPLVEEPEYAAWILSDIAKYSAQAGQLSSALDVITQSCKVARRSENPVELRLRRVDRAELLLLTGQPRDAQLALDLLPFDSLSSPHERLHYPHERLREHLCWSRGLLQVGEITEAKKWLERAQTVAQTYNFDTSRVHELAQKMN